MSIVVVVGCGGGGATGMHGLQFNGLSRYQVVSTALEEVWVTSSANVYSYLTWTRTGSFLTLTRFNHGLQTGDTVIVRYANVDMVSGSITSTTADTFTLTTPSSGDSVGAAAVYTVGFSYAHIGSPKTGGSLFLPSGHNTDLIMTSMRIRTGIRAGTTYDLIVPTSAFNTFGQNTHLGDTYVPSYSVRQDADFLPAIGATISTGYCVGSYVTFRFANLGLGSQSRYIILDF
jgi:hypothetical protein